MARRNRGERSFLNLVFLLGLSWALWGLVRDLGMYRAEAPGSVLALSLRVAALFVGAVSSALWWWRAVREPATDGAPGSLARTLRTFVYAAGGGTLIPTILVAAGSIDPRGPWVGSLFASGGLLGIGVWTLVVTLTGATHSGPGRLARIADVAAFNVLIALVLAEGALLVTQRVFPTSILYDDSTAASQIEPYRDGWSPRGYYDDDFFRAGADDYVVGFVGDSFGVGIVTRPNNWITVAEERLRQSLGRDHDRVAIHNFSLNFNGLREYTYMIRTEIMQTNPSRVVVSLFVGNDIQTALQHEDASAGRYLLQEWLVAKVFLRLRRIFTGLERSAPQLYAASETGEDFEQEAVYIADPSLEPPTLTGPAFLRVERNALEAFNTRTSEAAYSTVFERLEVIREMVGPRLLLVIIPDQLQVDDTLYERLLTSVSHAGAYDREFPQKRIREWCREHDVEVLDLLPPIRDAHRGGRTYHFRDPHWNTRGNRAAGEALAETLAAAASP